MEDPTDNSCTCDDTVDCICRAVATNINCIKHGLFDASVMDFLRGIGCPKCDMEVFARQKIDNCLTNLALQYPRDPLRFDFYLPEYNLLIYVDNDIYHDDLIEHPNCLTEYFFNPMHEHKKDRYCIDNKMILLRLWDTPLSKSDQVIAAALMYIKNHPVDTTGYIIGDSHYKGKEGYVILDVDQ